MSTPRASLFSTIYILQIWRAVDFRHVYTKHSCWLCWDLLGRINTVHQKPYSLNSLLPIRYRHWRFPYPKDLLNSPALPLLPLIPPLHHKFSFLPCPGRCSQTQLLCPIQPFGSHCSRRWLWGHLHVVWWGKSCGYTLPCFKALGWDPVLVQKFSYAKLVQPVSGSSCRHWLCLPGK